MGKRMVNRHHRKPKSHGGNGKPRNISLVPEHLHRAYHMLFSNKTPHEIAQELSTRWIDPDYVLVAQKRR